MDHFPISYSVFGIGCRWMHIQCLQFSSLHTHTQNSKCACSFVLRVPTANGWTSCSAPNRVNWTRRIKYWIHIQCECLQKRCTLFTFELHYVCIRFSFKLEGFVIWRLWYETNWIGMLHRYQNEHFYLTNDELRSCVFPSNFFGKTNRFLYFTLILNSEEISVLTSRFDIFDWIL